MCIVVRTTRSSSAGRFFSSSGNLVVAVLLAAGGSLSFSADAFAVAPQESGGREATVTRTAVGVVFEDRNDNQVRDADEPGIARVRVSNGETIVLTDAEGRYSLPVDDDEIIFVIKPRNYATPLSDDNLPRFYYIHKPAGSRESLKFAGVKPTGPLPDSIDFPLRRRQEPESFKAIMFGDPQPRNLTEVNYIQHDVVEQIIAEHAHDAAFGVTLGDIVFDDLTILQPLNRAIALIGIPWYNVIGNHDLNLEAVDDAESDETFERIYGPSYYSFDYGPAHFLVLDDVTWHGGEDGKKGHYHGGLGPRQLAFIRQDLAMIPEDQLVVLMMHIPLNEVRDRQDLYRMIEKRPATVSLSAHTHYMEHRLIDQGDGWKGPEPHHHIVNVTVSGSWWRGQKDERGIPHATMSDGGPNGYSIMEFDGADYSLTFRAAGRPAEYQMNIYAPEEVDPSQLAETLVMANVFNGSPMAEVAMRIKNHSDWMPMKRVTLSDPAFVALQERESALSDRKWVDLPKPHPTPHIWQAMLPSELPPGTHSIQVRFREKGNDHVSERIFRVRPSND